MKKLWVYLVVSEDTEDRRSKIASAHKTKEGAERGVVRWNTRPIQGNDGGSYPAKVFGASATITQILLED